ncbi:hypothetical protein [Embleya sp. NPDC005971]|uniref:hypothetical protein n=1 Tax=Embleya sp. NPDC005971 TaxID=3156724 RepID=UPI0033C2350C
MAYYKARVDRKGPDDLTDTLAYEGGAAALVRYGVVDRIREYGPSRSAEVENVYRSAVATDVQVYLSPPGSADPWFMAHVREIPTATSTGGIYRTAYLWVHQEPSGRWRVVWWMPSDEAKTGRDPIPPKVGPGKSWTPPTDPASLIADPATICQKIAPVFDPKIKDWVGDVPWGAQAQETRDRVEYMWGPKWLGQYLEGGSFSATSYLWPGPPEPAWEAANGDVIVPCTIVLDYSMRPAPGKVVKLYGDTAFEQSSGATQWTRWDQRLVDRSLVTIPRKGSTSTKVEYIKFRAYPLWAEGVKP